MKSENMKKARTDMPTVEDRGKSSARRSFKITGSKFNLMLGLLRGAVVLRVKSRE